MSRRLHYVKFRHGSYGFKPRGRWFSLLTDGDRTVGFVVRFPASLRWRGLLKTGWEAPR